eukprot:scaffold8124_cov99-Isochrysis_galbana.AAC.6
MERVPVASRLKRGPMVRLDRCEHIQIQSQPALRRTLAQRECARPDIRYKMRSPSFVPRPLSLVVRALQRLLACNSLAVLGQACARLVLEPVMEQPTGRPRHPRFAVQQVRRVMLGARCDRAQLRIGQSQHRGRALDLVSEMDVELLHVIEQTLHARRRHGRRVGTRFLVMQGRRGDPRRLVRRTRRRRLGPLGWRLGESRCGRRLRRKWPIFAKTVAKAHDENRMHLFECQILCLLLLAVAGGLAQQGPGWRDLVVDAPHKRRLRRRTRFIFEGGGRVAVIALQQLVHAAHPVLLPRLVSAPDNFRRWCRRVRVHRRFVTCRRGGVEDCRVAPFSSSGGVAWGRDGRRVRCVDECTSRLSNSPTSVGGGLRMDAHPCRWRRRRHLDVSHAGWLGAVLKAAHTGAA